MSSIKDLEDGMNENLKHDIIGMDNDTIGIEEAFLVESESNETHLKAQESSEEPQEQIINNNNNGSNKSGSITQPRAQKFITTTFNDIQQGNQTKAFRFVNNSPNSMYKPKSRMKPTFKVESQPTQNGHRPPINNESLIIEQKFDNDSAEFETNDKRYVFQLNVKRPPGRPRKYPAEKPKAKRPQGRPRKYPVEVTGSTINNTKITKKMVRDPATQSLPIDTELMGPLKRSRGRPRRDDKDTSGHDLDTDDAYGRERNFAIATANSASATQAAQNQHHNGANAS